MVNTFISLGIDNMMDFIIENRASETMLIRIERGWKTRKLNNRKRGVENVN